MAGSPSFLSDGHTPRRTDAKWAIQQKILGAIIDNGGGSDVPAGAGFNMQGDGAPVAPPVDPTVTWFYKDRVGGGIYAWNTDTQAWE